MMGRNPLGNPVGSAHPADAEDSPTQIAQKRPHGGSRLIDLVPLKLFAASRLSRESKLCRVLLLEPDRISPEDFVAKLGTWLALLSVESGSRQGATTIG